MIASFYRDYWSNDEKRKRIIEYQNSRRKKLELEKKKKYDIDFEKRKSFEDTKSKEECITDMVIYKDNLMTRIFKFVKKIFKK
jgi:hypothetical protein